MWEDKETDGKIRFKTLNIRRGFQGRLPELQQLQQRRGLEGAGGGRNQRAVGRQLLIDWGTLPNITTFCLWKRKLQERNCGMSFVTLQVNVQLF